MLKYIYNFSEKERGNGQGLDYPKPQKGWIWLHLTKPTADELSKIQSEFSIPQHILTKFFREKRSIRYSFKPLTFILVDYYLKGGKVGLEKVLFSIGENYIITISDVQLPHYDEVYNMILERDLTIKSTGYLFYEILDRDVEENFDVLNVTENKIIDLEKNILTPSSVKKKVTQIIEFKRYLTQMWRRFWRSSKIIFSIKKGLTPVKVDENLIRLLDDIHDTYIYQMEMVGSQRDVLSDALTIHESVLANRLAMLSNKINSSLKKLTLIVFFWTAIATILSVPNTVATILGIPELPIKGDAWPWIALALVISSIVPIFWFFSYWKKIKEEHAEDKVFDVYADDSLEKNQNMNVGENGKRLGEVHNDNGSSYMKKSDAQA